MSIATLAKALTACCAAGVLFSVLGTGAPAQAASTCLAITGGEEFGKPYRCTNKRDDGFKSSTCMRAIDNSFSWPKTFTMQFPVSGTVLRCTCEAGGTFAAPTYHKSLTFLCGDNGNQDAATGTFVITGSKITKGQYMDGTEPFHSWVYQCVPDPTC